jgi:hypothetical protein
MRTLIALAIGLMMLVSAAAATGTGNYVDVDIESELENNCIQGVTVAQVTMAETYLVGCDNDVYQEMDFSIEDNSLLGGVDAWRDSVTQVGAQIANATGSTTSDQVST